jgi:hypothetical protein
MKSDFSRFIETNPARDKHIRVENKDENKVSWNLNLERLQKE